MPRVVRLNEAQYYPAVERFLRRRFHCFVTAKNRGTKFGRVDVVGIREIGGDLSGDVELVGVEVKRGNQPFNTATGQAFGYSVYAERCYLADLRLGSKPFTIEEMDIASKLGVGLLAISPSRQVTEVLSSPQHFPLLDMRRELIEKMGYSVCTICNTPFRRGEPGSWSRHVRRSLEKAYEQEKGLVYWLYEPDRRRKAVRKYNYVRRYICPDCVWNLYGDLLERG